MLNIDPAARPEMDDVDNRARAALAHQVIASLPPSSSPRIVPSCHFHAESGLAWRILQISSTDSDSLHLNTCRQTVPTTCMQPTYGFLTTQSSLTRSVTVPCAC
jgi:hypothetical protein